jgi:putative transposase
MPLAADLRKGRVSLDCQIHHVTTATLNREPVFLDFNHARLFIQTLRQSELKGETKTMAFVVMPDHIHWLFQLNQGEQLSSVIQALKSISAKRVGKPVWQKGFYDHGIRKDEDVASIARYIVDNPVRAG